MSRIIKAPSPGPSRPARVAPGTVVPQAIQTAREEAGRARAALAQEVAQRRAQLAIEEAEALAKARANGYDAGLGDATELIARLALAQEAWLASAETEVLELGLAAAERILGREIAERGAAVDIVGEALRTMRRARTVKVRLHPDDLEIVRAAEPLLLARLTQGATIALIEDQHLARGSALVESEQGRVDARLETQLAALRRALFSSGEGP